MPKKPPPLSPATAAVRGTGVEAQKSWRSLTTDIAQTSVFVSSVDELKEIAEQRSQAYMYTRYANPTTRAAEEHLAALEGAEDCVVTASGQAAMFAAMLATCRSGDEIVAMQDLYGGTLRLFSEVLERFDVRARLVPFSAICDFGSFLSERTRLVVLESPTNPTLRCVDLRALCSVARERGAVTLVDNTFATPMLQQPLALGADLVMHSATKYLGGHSDLSAGALCGGSELIAECRRMHILTGGTLDPHAAYLLIRGMKTLSLRMERATQNAQQIAATLAHHPAVTRVYYPSGDPIAEKQMKMPGAMLAFELKGGAEAAERFLRSTRLWALATSLGGVESTLSYPVLASHVGLEDQWEALGITPALVRLSVGVEDFDDLMGDLEQALAA